MKRILAATVLAILATPLASSAGGPLPGGPTSTLAGVWLVRIEPDPAAGLPPFRELLTLGSDGSLLAVDDNAPAPPFPFTYGVGVWDRFRGASRPTHASFMYLLYDPSTFGSAGTARVRRTIVPDGPDSFTGTDEATVTDINGQILFQATGTLTATRVTPESF